ncbi:MAG: 16S rRNA (cytosine(1402)-N(4))-methyltransferase RsmH [Deltaproteobacteria bacterium]|nr:16S rRNA (cytosine(1402)-N(4))-methyltransferase RsmH [Deltaproteobacteria bacterium]
MEYNHISVLHTEVAQIIKENSPIETAVDVTLGGGGHTTLLIEALTDNGKLIAFDRDAAALDNFREKYQNEKSVILINRSFSQFEDVMKESGVEGVDFILADLGISSHQVDTAERGFSFSKSGPLDMRMDRSSDYTLKDFLEETDEYEFIRILREYGEERQAARIAKGVLAAYEAGRIKDTAQLAQIISDIKNIPAWKIKTHPATKSFQALRIHINDELGELKSLLESVPSFLNRGGVFCVITFHSLEDRLVKRLFHDLAHPEKQIPDHIILTRDEMPVARFETFKSITPSKMEIERNPRSRSSRLRILRRNYED